MPNICWSQLCWFSLSSMMVYWILFWFWTVSWTTHFKYWPLGNCDHHFHSLVFTFYGQRVIKEIVSCSPTSLWLGQSLVSLLICIKTAICKQVSASISAGSVILALMKPEDREESQKGRCPAWLKTLSGSFSSLIHKDVPVAPPGYTERLHVWVKYLASEARSFWVVCHKEQGAF